MWYKTKLGDQDAIMWLTNKERIVFVLDAEASGWRDKYLAWVAEGNEAEPWNSQTEESE